MYQRFRRWRDKGIWEKLLEILVEMCIRDRSVMRQLAYMGKVQAQENMWCALSRKPVPALIDAFDVMMLMCDDTVPQFRVEHDQCQLTFYLPGEAGELHNSFKVYYVCLLYTSRCV